RRRAAPAGCRTIRPTTWATECGREPDRGRTRCATRRRRRRRARAARRTAGTPPSCVRTLAGASVRGAPVCVACAPTSPLSVLRPGPLGPRRAARRGTRLANARLYTSAHRGFDDDDGVAQRAGGTPAIRGVALRVPARARRHPRVRGRQRDALPRVAVV